MKSPIYGLFATIGLIWSSTAFAGELVEGVPNFVSEGTLVGTSTCDSGATVFSSYNVDNGGRGITITVNNNILYYIFSPNPDSMSPITWTFTVDDSGNLIGIPGQERDENLKTEAPQLHSLFHEKENDCVHQRF
jgi:hypothetical protein